MSSATQQSPIPAGTVFSAVLPWVNPGHHEEFLRETLEKSGWGRILKVDWSLRRNARGREFFVVYVHFGTFPNEQWRKFLEDGGELKVYFNPRNFWKVRASRWKPRQPPVFVPHVEFPVGVHAVNPWGPLPPPPSVAPPPLPMAVENKIQEEMNEVLDAIADEVVATDEEIMAAGEEFVIGNEINNLNDSGGDE